MKSFSKSYMASLVTEGPSDTLQSLIFHQQRFHHDGSGTGQRLRAIDRMCCFRPRFWFDSQALTLDASVTNMITLEILPEDILESVHESTQAFIIETGLYCAAKSSFYFYTNLTIMLNVVTDSPLLFF